MKRAEAERTGPAAALESKTRSSELDVVVKAGEERRAALILWRRQRVEVARWQLAAAEAQLELASAEAVARTGADVDPERFRGQVAFMQNGRGEANRKVAQTRAQLDAKERALNDAKDRYAATRRVTPSELVDLTAGLDALLDLAQRLAGPGRLADGQPGRTTAAASWRHPRA